MKAKRIIGRQRCRRVAEEEAGVRIDRNGQPRVPVANRRNDARDLRHDHMRRQRRRVALQLVDRCLERLARRRMKRIRMHLRQLAPKQIEIGVPISGVGRNGNQREEHANKATKHVAALDCRSAAAVRLRSRLRQ